MGPNLLFHFECDTTQPLLRRSLFHASAKALVLVLFDCVYQWNLTLNTFGHSLPVYLLYCCPTAMLLFSHQQPWPRTLSGIDTPGVLEPTVAFMLMGRAPPAASDTCFDLDRRVLVLNANKDIHCHAWIKD